MPTYGQHPSDVVQDSRGNALPGVLLQFYLTEAAARAGSSPVGSAVSDQYGTWEFTTDELDLWTRLPNGRVWQVAHSDAEVVAAAQAAQTAAANAAANAASIGANKLDTSVAASTYATKTEVTSGLSGKADNATVAAKLDSATAASTYETKANVTSGLAAKLNTATAASTYETKTNVTNGLAAKLDSATAASTYETKTNVTNGLAGKVSKGDIVFRVADYASAQACIDAAPSGAVVLFPIGTTTISAPLSITKPLTLRGQGLLNSTIVANGCDGIRIAQGMSQVNIESLCLSTATLYTTTTNTLIGIDVAGIPSARAGYDTFRDLYVKGFQTAIRTSCLLSSHFTNIHTSNCLTGLDIYGVGMNNTVADCKIVVGDGTPTRLPGSTGIRLTGQSSAADATPEQNEGWMIHDSLVYGGDVNVDAKGVANCVLAGNIIDFSHIYGVRLAGNGASVYGSNWTISNNYIATVGAIAGSAAITSDNTVGTAPTVRGVAIAGNNLLSYGASGTYGIVAADSPGAVVMVTANMFSKFASADILLQGSGSIVTGNRCQSQIYPAAGRSNLVADNYGPVLLDGSGGFPNVYATVSGQKVMRDTAAPTAGTWARGDRVQHSAPAVGSPKGWVCTVAGSPGTWVSEGNL